MASKEDYTIDLGSEIGADYTQLRDLLAEGKWKEADQETARVMRKAAGKEERDRLEREDIENFPCTDLHTIDQLWVKYSNTRFGFSVQKQIWESFGGQPGGYYNDELWKKLSAHVGWYNGEGADGGWVRWEYFKFNQIPSGGLPAQIYCAYVIVGAWSGWFPVETQPKVGASLLERAETCKV